MFKLCLLCLFAFADPMLRPTANPPVSADALRVTGFNSLVVPPACIAPAKQVAGGTHPERPEGRAPLLDLCAAVPMKWGPAIAVGVTAALLPPMLGLTPVVATQPRQCLLTGYSGVINQQQYLQARTYVGRKGVLDILGNPYCSFNKTFVYLLQGSAVQVRFGENGVVLEVVILGAFLK